MSRVLVAGLFAALCATPVLAQSTAPAPSPPAPGPNVSPLGGPQIPGLCLLSQQAVFANAKIGLAAAARLTQLTEQTQAEINVERQSVETEAKSLEAQRSSLTPVQAQKKQQALAGRVKALQDKAALRSREIELTRQKALNRIGDELRPVLAQVYAARGCGLLIDRGSVLGGNMAGDLTAAAVQGLDARITTITFDREIVAPTPSANR